ncbi:hypothetical protein BKA57DRAFT_505672 [Linnemannia elongata]|nr:hypothetical protein BKA57DRAFT_505672 [Linnemannia elongata]
MKAPNPNTNNLQLPPPLPPTSSSQKQKTLSIHIATDHIGPSKMPLVYGSTLEKVGSIRGTVRFSTNYPCRGKDIVIMYEAKAEAQWSALENKKVVMHQTEEILGYHIWHFPLEHTKTGGSTVAVGVYEKEFEIPLVHPSLSAAAAASPSSSLRNNINKPSSSSPSSPSPSSSAGSAASPSKINSALVPHTTSTARMVGAKPVGPVTASATAAGLLPSSSYSPQARIKYTIRAILQRPFPCITHIEASQEVWVLNSSLPPQFPLLSPSNSTGRRSHSNASSKKRRQSTRTDTTSAAATTTTTAITNLAPAEKAADKESSKSLNDSEVLKSQPLLSLPMPSQVFKSALAMLPSIDLSRSKQLFSMSKTTGPSSAPTSESGSGSGSGAGSGSGTTAAALSSQPSTSAATTTPANAAISSATTTTTATKDSMDSTSEAGSSSSCSSVSSPRLNGRENNYNHPSYPEDTDNENIADYTGVWEAFDIPYSLSLPSEMVYLGQVVPLTIRFGPHRGHYSSSNNKQQEQGNGSRQNIPSRRFVVKKGVLRLVEHTLLREVTTTQGPKLASAQNKNHNKSLALMTTNAHASSQATLEQAFEDDGSTKDSSHRRAFSEQQPHPNSNGKSKRLVPLFGKRQDQNAIYQEQGYHGSHSHLPLPGEGDSGIEQQQQRNTKTQHQHQLSLPGGGDAHSSSHKHEGDLRRSFFKPGRHSMDVSTGRPVSMVNPYGPTKSGNPRIVSSIEAKFKTEVMFLSLTPFLQRQEQWYQRQLKKNAFASAAGSAGRTLDGSDGDKDALQQEENDEDDDKEERGDIYVEEEDVEEDIEDGVWQTTIWVPIPGPSAMATFTETKNIVKTHTLQLILLCGLSGEAVPVPTVVVQSEDGETDSGSGSTAASVAAVSLSNVNKEFRIEMDLHVTGPRSPIEMTIRHL